MLNLIIFVILIVVLFSLNVIHSILKSMEYKMRKLKFFIAILFIILSLVLVLNYDSYILLKNPEDHEIIILGLSQMLLILSIFLFMNSFRSIEQDLIELKCPSRFKSRSGKIELGRVLKKSRRKQKFFLSLEDLARHMFVCGLTGSGKSNFIQNFLINLKNRYNIPLLIFEFKGEYNFLQNHIEDLLIIRPGENFSINIFNPMGSNAEIHAERIFDILQSGQFLDSNAEYSPQMQKVLVDILKEVCSNRKYQNWKSFFNQCAKYSEKNERKIPMLHQTLISIQNRIRRFSSGPLKAIFENEHSLDLKKIFERNILIDLSSIIRFGGEKKDAMFFLNMILKYLWDMNLKKGSFNFKGIKHITVVEDAQYFAPKSNTHQIKISSYLEDIALLLRGTGECLITIATRPQISEEILANCGVMVTFKNHMERGFLCRLLNLEEEKQDYLSILERGQCVIRTDSIKRPFLLWIPHIERRSLKRSEIKTNNKIIYSKLKGQK